MTTAVTIIAMNITCFDCRGGRIRTVTSQTQSNIKFQSHYLLHYHMISVLSTMVLYIYMQKHDFQRKRALIKCTS